MSSGPTASIRRGSGPDAEAVARLHVDSWRATYRSELPAWYLDALDIAARTIQWRNRIALPGVRILMANDGDDAVGFAAFGPSRDGDLDQSLWSQLYNFHVAPSQRGHGVGLRLWQAMLAELAPEGSTGLTLWVVGTNLEARQFYERRGLRADGRVQFESLAPGAGFEELRYRRTFADMRP